jgi:hypothetical protein
VGVIRTEHRIRLYVNGILDAVNATNGATDVNEEGIFIGGSPWYVEECDMPLYLDEIKYWDKELSEGEIEGEASGALGGIEPYYVRLGCINCSL